VTISTGLWFVNAAFITQGIVRARSAWVSSRSSCTVINTEENKLNIIVTLALDMVLLLTMLAGLLRLRRDGSGRFGVAQLLWNQGVLWLLLATVAGVPPTVLISLNLNAILNLMLQLPSTIILTIATTRMYRSLTDFVSGSTDITFEGVLVCDNTGACAKKYPCAPTPPRQNEVSVDTVCGQFPVSDDSELSRSMDDPDQSCDKPHGLPVSLEKDLESAVSIEMV